MLNFNARTSLISLVTRAAVWGLTVLAIALAVIRPSSLQAAEEKTNKYAIQILSEKAVIVYYMVPAAESFPAEYEGFDLSFSFAPQARYRLNGVIVEMKTVSGGTKKAFQQWGLEIPQINWDALKTAFESEVKRAYTPENTSSNGNDLSKNKPVLPGSIGGKVSSEDLAKVGKVTSIIFAVAPDSTTAIAATAAGALILLDDLTGKSGLAVGYNPFIGTTLIIPENMKEGLQKVVGDVSGTVFGETVGNLTQLSSDLKNGKLSPKSTLNLILPVVTFVPSQVKAEAEKVIKKPIEAAQDLPKNTKTEVNKGLENAGIPIQF